MNQNFQHSWPRMTTILSLMNVGKFSKSEENTVRKGEIARNEQFLLFSQCFHSVFKRFELQTRKTRVCRWFSGRVFLSLVIQESLFQAALDPLGRFGGMSLGKTSQSPRSVHPGETTKMHEFCELLPRYD